MNLGYVGLGSMGGALARRLMLQHKLRVYDLNPERVAEFAEAGAIPSQSAAALAAECDMVMTCLPTSKEVRDAVFGANGIAEGLKAGGLVADMTTGDPNATKALSAEAAARGVTLIDAPVSGGPHGAQAGTIAIMVGAPADVFARVKPVFEAISPNIFHCGDVGAGHTMKLVNNVIAAGIKAITFEGFVMGVKNGLDPSVCATVLDKSSGYSSTSRLTLPQIAENRMKTTFQLGLMLKDVSLATQLGAESASPMPISGMVRELYRAALVEHGYSNDVNSLVHLFERMADTKVVGR